MAASNLLTNGKSPTANVKPNRLPAPTLFVGPPSRNASQLSVSRVPPESGGQRAHRQPFAHGASTRPRRHNIDGEDGSPKEGREPPKIRKPSEKSVDARWREMQSTLNEVELTAQSSTHVFGESHARALDDLRDAQIALARAWGRGNDDKATDSTDEAMDLNIDRFKGAHDLATERRQTAGRKRTDTEASGSTVLSGESALSDSSVRSGRSALEDETAQDIRLASERRAANEAYFKRVDQGVKEVVARLEKVAEAMRGVEGESRSLWSETASSGSGMGSNSGSVVGPNRSPPDIVLEGEEHIRVSFTQRAGTSNGTASIERVAGERRLPANKNFRSQHAILYRCGRTKMPERNAILDLVGVWLTCLRFSEPQDSPELLLADVLIDLVLVLVASLQLRQTIVRGRQTGRYENFAVTIYFLLMLDALTSDCQALMVYKRRVAGGVSRELV